MKKIIPVLLTILMLLTMASCGKNTDHPADNGQSAMNALPENASPAQTVIADFTDKVNSGQYASMEALANAILESDYIPFMGAAMAVEPGYLNGFTEEITGFKEGHTFGPAIGSIPFVGYVFVVDDGVKAEDFMETLKKSADLRWNICTQADEMLAANVGSTVCFVMSPASFEE